MSNSTKKMAELMDQAASSDETYAALSPDLKLILDKIVQSRPELGPEFLKKAGPGMEFYEAKEYVQGDDRRTINARLSARSPVPIVVHKQAEIRQYAFLCRLFSDSAHYQSEKAYYSVDEACNTSLFALANHLVKNEVIVSILNSSSLYRGGNVSPYLADHLLNIAASSSPMPEVLKSIPKDSTIVVFGDFVTNKIEVIEEGLDHLRSMGLTGYLVMVADPQTLELDFTGNAKFVSCDEGQSSKGEKDIVFNKTLKQQYLERMRSYLEGLKKACEDRGFHLVLQRTDEPLEKGLISLYQRDSSHVDQQIQKLPQVKKEPV